MAFVCVVGRTFISWLGFTGMIAVQRIWFSAHGADPLHAVTGSASDLAVLALATVFVITVGPAAHAIFELRAAAARRAAEIAASEAAASGRHAALAELQHVARALIEHIAEGKFLDDDASRHLD